MIISVTANSKFQLPQDYLDFFDALEQHDVDYVIVGAYAMAAWGYVRTTGDIDVLIVPTQENSARLMDALKTFGAPTQGLAPEDFTKEGVVFQMGRPPLRIDILTSLDGVKTPASTKEISCHSDAFGKKLPVLLIDTLIENKLATGRTRDKADIEELKRLRKQTPK